MSYAISAACLVLAAASAMASSAPAITVRNNHDSSYAGELTFKTSTPDGNYSGPGASGRVSRGQAQVWGTFPGRSSVTLSLAQQVSRTASQVASDGTGLIAGGLSIQLGLVVVPGRTGGLDAAVSQFRPLALQFERDVEGTYSATGQQAGYRCSIKATPSHGAVDISCTISALRQSNEPVYVALVRRVTGAGVSDLRTRWNGRQQHGLPPDEYNREFWYVRGLDWCSWRQGNREVGVVNGFTPGFMVKTELGRHIIGNSFYVWESVRQEQDDLYFVSEICRGNPQQETSKFIPVKTYAPLPQGVPLTLRWRLALPARPSSGWQDAELECWAGFRKTTENGSSVTLDIGAADVQFGTSYFPYSTLAENFDHYRTPGLDREGWWPFSPRMWEQWRKFIPMMQTDLRIIKSMGFQWVRLHHLELLGDMARPEALAFLDFYTNECRKLGLYVLADTAGSPQWISQIMGRYGDRIRRLEIENEVLIPGIRPEDPERWTAQYTAARSAAPDAQVFLTGTANQPVFDQLVMLGVPFDRVGIHMYKHGPGWEESFRSLAMGVGAHARDLDREVTMGEFNWKELTRLSPEKRAQRFSEIYGYILEPRAISELFQFHFQETLCVNPSLTRQGIRHYETISLDRRPKPEALEMMKLIRRYSAGSYGQNKVLVSVTGTSLKNGSGTAAFMLRNQTRSKLRVSVAAESFGGLSAKVDGTAAYTLLPGEVAKGKLLLRLDPQALPGTFHVFVKTSFAGDASYGWAVVSNPGSPTISPEPALPGLVEYDSNPATWTDIDWARPISVAFGASAPVLELEMAYLLANTLQSATGRQVRLCSTADLTKEAEARGLLLLVGSSKTNPLIRGAAAEGQKGRVGRSSAGGALVIEFTGAAPEQVQAAVTDFVLRYWKSAKDSATHITGLEKGAALGNKALPGDVNLP